MKWIDKIFGRERQPEQQPPPQAMCIEGISDAPLTPEPDDAELAAQAVLELMAQGDKNQGKKDTQKIGNVHDAEYYKALARRIREAHETARLRTMRFLTYCETMLQQPTLPVTGPNSLSLMEAELYKRIDIIERHGGELKKRWQHCLATVTVRLMQATGQITDETTNEKLI